MLKEDSATAWKYGPKRMYVAVSAFVFGLMVGAARIRPFQRIRQTLRVSMSSGRALGALSLVVGGCLLVIGAREAGGALFGHAVQEQVQAELLADLPEPLDLIVQVQGADPFSYQPDASSLRLRVATEDGLEFASEIKRGQIKELPLPSHLIPPGQRVLLWQSVVDGAINDVNRLAAARMSSLDDWRRVTRVEADLVTQIPEGVTGPESLAVSLYRSEGSIDQPALKIFEGDKASANVSQEGEATVIRYRDELSGANRMASWEKAAVQDRLWPISGGLLGAGVLFLAAGCGILFIARRPSTQQMDKMEGESFAETAWPRPVKETLPPLWFWLVLQAAALLIAYGHMSYFRLAPEGIELGQRAFTLEHDAYLPHNLDSELSWQSFVKSLNNLRTFVFPLFANGVRSLTPSFVAWQFGELVLRILAVFVFYLGLRAVRVTDWLALAASSVLLYSCFRWDASFRHTIFIDVMAECFPLLTVGMLLLVVGRPRSVLAWGGLTLSLFLTYQARPAFLFLVGLVPLLGVLLAGLLWDRTASLRQRLQMGLGLLAAGVLPYLGWCSLRWLLVGHFGLVSFGGISLICITGHFLTEDVIPELPNDLRPIGRAVLRDLNELPEWKPCVDGEGRFIPSIVDDAGQFGSRSIELATIISREAGEGKEEWVVVNRNLSELGKALIKARPRSYANWLTTAATIGVTRMVTDDPLLKYLAWVLGVLLVIWHVLCVIHFLRAGPTATPPAPRSAVNYSLALTFMTVIAVGFALTNLLLVILVAPPEFRYMKAAGIFLPSVLVVLMFVVGRQIGALLPTVAGIARPLATFLQDVKHEILGRPMPGIGHRGLVWKSSLLLAIVVWCAYMANGREIRNEATAPSELVPVAFLRGNGPFLDRFGGIFPGWASGERLPPYLGFERGHLVSTNPPGTALVAVPFYLPQVLVADRLRPGWEQQKVLLYTGRMAKNTAAILGALTAVAIFHLLRRLELGRLAWPTALAAALASNLWADSQTLGPQVPTALALTLSILLLVPPPVPRWRLGLAGLATGVLVWIQPQHIILVAVIVSWVAWTQPRNLPWFLSVLLVFGAMLVGYNHWLFGSAWGGSGDMAGRESVPRGLAGLFESVAGSLWGPQRGLFVFCPWVVAALATLPAVVGRLRQCAIVSWLLLALVPCVVLGSLNPRWWGVNYFGPQPFTDILPLFAVLLGFGLAWSWARFRAAWAAFGVCLAFAAGVQWLGAFYYPGSTELTGVESTPMVAASAFQRAWNQYDGELGRLGAAFTRDWVARGWRFMGYADNSVETQAFKVYRPGTLIDLSQASSAAYLAGAWYGPEEGGQWTGRHASVRFRLERPQPLQLRMMVSTLGTQRIVVCLNGREVNTVPENEQPDLVQVDLPPDAIAESNTLALILPDAKSRKSVGMGDDDRIIGAAIAWIELVPLSEPVYQPGSRIDFTQASPGVLQHGIWFAPDAERQWSGWCAGVSFRLEHVQPLRLRMMATIWGKQQVVFRFNGREVKTLHGEGAPLDLIVIVLPSDAVAERNSLDLTAAGTKSPQSLGVGVAWMEFEPLSEKD
jgi:hypothetical protein